LNYYKHLRHLLFIDIETASITSSYSELPTRLQPEWDKRAMRWDRESPSSEVFPEKAAIHPEFGKVIVIGAGYFRKDEEGNLTFRVTAFQQEEEQDILLKFKELLEERFDYSDFALVAHNGKEFDYPYICRRMLINGIELPKSLQIYDKKPWQIPHLDTMEMWRFGDVRTYTSLELLASVFDIESSKTDLDGSKVSKVYYETHDLQRIANYCQEDVITTARIYLKLKSLPDLNQEYIYKV